VEEAGATPGLAGGLTEFGAGVTAGEGAGTGATGGGTTEGREVWA
jgi:hypothetical protein